VTVRDLFNAARGDGHTPVEADNWMDAVTTKSDAVDTHHHDDVVLNVVDYGATGDGTTDDAAAILAAVADAKSLALPSTTVYFPVGTYLCSQPIDCDGADQLRLVGAGSRLDRRPALAATNNVITSELRFTGTGPGHFISAKQSVGFLVQGLAVRYSSSQFTGTIIDAGVNSDPPTYGLVIRDALFGSAENLYTTADTCLNLWGIVEAEIYGTTFSGAKYGLRGRPEDVGLGGFSNVVNMHGGRFVDLELASVRNPETSWSFFGTVFQNIKGGGAVAVKLGTSHTARNLNFIGCGFWDAGAAGSWIDASAAGSTVIGCKITGCYLDVPTVAYAATFNSCNGFEFTSNNVNGKTAGGVLFGPAGSGNTVRGVRIGGNNLVNITDNSATLTGWFMAPQRGPAAFPIKTLSTSATLTVNEGGVVLCDATTAAVTVTLPAAATAVRGLTFTVKKTDQSANTVTLAPAGADTIDGLPNRALTDPNDVLEVVTDGTTWRVTSAGGSGGGGTATYLAFDAGGNASAARPAVPTSTTVAWFNVPSVPANLGTFDVWEDTSV
jgi:hypothetical protein